MSIYFIAIEFEFQYHNEDFKKILKRFANLLNINEKIDLDELFNKR